MESAHRPLSRLEEVARSDRRNRIHRWCKRLLVVSVALLAFVLGCVPEPEADAQPPAPVERHLGPLEAQPDFAPEITLGPVIQLAPGQTSHQTWSQGQLDETGVAVSCWHQAQNVYLRAFDPITGVLGNAINLSASLGKQVDECRIIYDRKRNRGTVVSSWRYGVGGKVSMDSIAWTFELDPATLTVLVRSGPWTLSPDEFNSSWRPMPFLVPGGLFGSIQTEGWGEDTWITIFTIDGVIVDRYRVHPPSGTSQNYAHALSEDWISWREGNTAIILNGQHVGTGWQQRVGRSEIVWETLQHHQILARPLDLSTPARVVGEGRDCDTAGPFIVWEITPWLSGGGSYIEGSFRGGAPVRLTDDLTQGNAPFGELDRRTPDIEWLHVPGEKPYGVLFFSGFLTPNGQRRAMARRVTP